MNFILLIIGLIGVIVALEMMKHLLFKKTSKMIIIFFIVLILFFAFSYTFRDVETFQDNKVIQTSAVVSEEIFGILKEKVDIGGVVNSTIKSNKLFKP